jgi:Lipase (class 3)
LATLFTADIAEFGIDAGRALPQLKASDPWWKSVAKVIGMATTAMAQEQALPPRPKTLQMYNFGSPRVGNVAFAQLFDRLLQEGKIDSAYRIVNGEDIVARLPRTVNGLVLGKINYDHVGKTVLINAPELDDKGNEVQSTTGNVPARLWIEGISDDKQCPIRDGTSLSSPMAPGMLLQELVEATQQDANAESKSWTDRFSAMAGKVTERIKTITASELTNILGIDTSFTDREVRIFQSLLRGKAVSHHLEDQYYGGMGKAGGFVARVGADIVDDAMSGTVNLALTEAAIAVGASDATPDNDRH